MDDKIVFLLNSDTHFNKDGIRPDKTNDINNMLKILKNEKIDLILLPGDLTDVGSDGKGSCWKKGSCFEVRYEFDQLSLLDDNLKLLEEYTDVYLSHGNHDAYWSSFNTVLKKFFGCSSTQYPVLHYIEKKYGSLNYSFYKKNVHFICLGMYPDKNGLEYLKKTLTTDKKTIIFFHFSLDSDESWWPTTEKIDFYNQIIKHKNIICICAGHHHITEDKFIYFNDVPIRFLNGAGPNSFLKCTYQNEQLITEIINN